MSDEFLRIARQEIQQELDGLESVLLNCSNDEDIFKNSRLIERRLHKIRGLAPMMGQETLGDLSNLSDVVLKYIIDKGVLKDSYYMIKESTYKMKETFSGKKIQDIIEFKNKFYKSFPSIKW